MAQHRLLLVMALGMTATAAFAQISPEFAKVLTNAGEQRMVVEAAKRSAVIVETPCSDAGFRLVDQIAIIQAPVFDQTGALKSGIWKQVVDYTGCDAHRTLTVLVTIIEGQRPNARPLLPGSTLADARLQIDVFRNPILQAQIKRWLPPTCDNAYVADTVVDRKESAPQPGAPAPGWYETWTIAMCDRKESISVTFVPEVTGTTYAISISAAPKGEPRVPAAQ